MKLVMWAPDISRAMFETAIGATGVDLVSVASLEEFTAAMSGAAIAMFPTPVYGKPLAAVLHANAGTLKLIQSMSAGLDRFLADPPSASAILATAGTAMSPPVAEHAVTLLLAVGRGIDAVIAQQGRAEWAPDKLRTRIVSLMGKRILIFGLGSIGREVAARLRPFGTTIVGMRRNATPDELAHEMHPASALDEVLPTVDATIICAPLTPETRHVFNASRFALMKQGALLVNIARGPLVDHDALAAALASGHLGGAGLDVTEPEPLPADHLLWRAPNVIISPHVAGPGGQRQLVDYIAENIKNFCEGKPLRAVVKL